MNHIIPTIFAHNKKEFLSRFKKLLPISKKLQIDFMDGKFVKAKSLSLSKILNLKKYKKDFEAHLMVLDPQKNLTKLKSLGFSKIIFHFESTKKETPKIAQKIKSLRLKPWIAINPRTPVEKVLPFLKELSGVLFMGVVPGKENQTFISTVLKKIKTLKKLSPRTKIQVDGGANPKTIKKLAKLGVNFVNSGSYISDSENPKKTVKELNSLFN